MLHVKKLDGMYYVYPTIISPMRKVYIFLLVIALGSCSKTVTVSPENYSWKNFKQLKEQTVDLSHYRSPNSREGQDAEKLVIFCASGGGSRAASLTVGTLLELEKILMPQQGVPDSKKNLLNEIDYFSTTSGGGWGASSFISYLYQKNKYGVTNLNPYHTFNEFEPQLDTMANFKYANNQFRYFIQDLFGSKGARNSNHNYMDRLNVGYLGWGFRAGLEEKQALTQGQTDFDKDQVRPLTLGDVFTLKNSGLSPRLPMIIANSTNIDNFFLVPFAPDKLKLWGLSQYSGLTKHGEVLVPERLPSSPLSLQELLEVPLAAGIKASSSVPLMISSTKFYSIRDSIPYYLRLADGGVLDNMALHTAKAILRQESTIINKANRIVIVLDASSKGIRTVRNLKPNKKERLKTTLKIASEAAPDGQYPITRERIQQLETEYNCTVIYLGTENLLDPELGTPGTVSKSVMKKKDYENKLLEVYHQTIKDEDYFKKMSPQKKAMLYSYIENYIPTWFSSKEINTPDFTTSKLLFAVGKGIVQLKKDEITDKIKNKGATDVHVE